MSDVAVNFYRGKSVLSRYLLVQSQDTSQVKLPVQYVKSV